MSYLSKMTDEDKQYIISKMPYRNTINYFFKNVKEFNKLRPGFRVQSISETELVRLLLAFSDKPFISNIIEQQLAIWLNEINNHYDAKINTGDTRIVAWLHTLPYSVFSENAELFFKLTDDSFSGEDVEIINKAVMIISETDEKCRKIEKDAKSAVSEIERLNKELKSEKTAIEKSKEKLKKRESEVVTLRQTLTELEKENLLLDDSKRKIKALEKQIDNYASTIKKLKMELSDTKEAQNQLEIKIRADLEKQQLFEKYKQELYQVPKRPVDVDEFREYLGYNFEDFGFTVDVEPDSYALLKTHLSKILFMGSPIIISRSGGGNLIKSIANAIIGQTNINTLVYRKEITNDDVENFLQTSGRIVCLDNFIGNYNENELLPLFDHNRGRMIFLTVSYDRTINYISKEFLKYCMYIDVKRIKALAISKVLTEDPSTIKEDEFVPIWAVSENRYSTLLRGLLSELGFQEGLINQKCTLVLTEQDLNGLLTFDILPFCVDVLQIKPFNMSEKLVKYAGASGKCIYKNLLMRWFG